MTLSHMRSLREVARAFFSFGSPRLLGAQLLVAVVLRPFVVVSLPSGTSS